MASVLVTRPQPGNAATAARLKALGHQVIAAPLFTVHSVQWTPPGEAIDAVMLTSANAPRLAGPVPDRLRALPCYAVGEATAKTAIAYGFTRTIACSRDAGAVLATMREDGIGIALHLAGRDHRRLPADIPRIVTRIVYAADAVDRLDPGAERALGSGAVDIALAYSARAARHLAVLLDAAGIDRHRVALGAISAQVADAAADGWKAVAIAGAPIEDQLFAACGLLCEKPGIA